MNEDDEHYWTYAQWLEATVGKIVRVADSPISPEDRAAWLNVQVRLAIAQALRHGRSGRGDNDPIAP